MIKVAKVGDIKKILSFGNLRRSNPKLDASVLCQTSWRVFWYPTRPYCAEVGPKWSPVCLLVPGFGHNGRVQPVHHLSIWTEPGQNLLKFCSSSPGRFERYATCHNFPRVAKMGTLGTIIRHCVQLGQSRFTSKTELMCRIVWGLFWYPSWPYYIDVPKNPAIL